MLYPSISTSPAPRRTHLRPVPFQLNPMTPPPRASESGSLPMVSTMRSSCPLYTVTLTPASSNSSTMLMTGFMKSPSMFRKTLSAWPTCEEAERGSSSESARMRAPHVSPGQPLTTSEQQTPHQQGPTGLDSRAPQKGGTNGTLTLWR